MSRAGALSSFFPEIEIDNFTARDGTVEFYGKVVPLLHPDDRVLDFGAGRAAWYGQDDSKFRSSLRDLRNFAKHVVACDVDAAVLENPCAHEVVQIDQGEKLPFDDASFDLIVSDYVFEHIVDPGLVCRELERLIKPGGWICARTPNRYAYISMLTRMIHNSRHVRFLSILQPEREEVDVFPTVFKLNSVRQLEAYFPSCRVGNFTYRYEPEPAYFGNSRLLLCLLLAVNWLVPPVMRTSLHVFLQKI
ncbi:MAG: class I SAM-dependent methyltransferase [Cyanobacteria bacterium P01_F01_bin.3]